MYQITDSDDERLLAEAETIKNARFAAMTIFSEGEPLPIIISLDGVVYERLVEGPHGPMIQASDLSRALR